MPNWAAPGRVQGIFSSFAGRRRYRDERDRLFGHAPPEKDPTDSHQHDFPNIGWKRETLHSKARVHDAEG